MQKVKIKNGILLLALTFHCNSVFFQDIEVKFEPMAKEQTAALSSEGYKWNGVWTDGDCIERIVYEFENGR